MPFAALSHMTVICSAQLERVAALDFAAALTSRPCHTRHDQWLRWCLARLRDIHHVDIFHIGLNGVAWWARRFNTRLSMADEKVSDKQRNKNENFGKPDKPRSACFPAALPQQSLLIH